MTQFTVDLPEEVAAAITRAAAERRSTPEAPIARLAADMVADRLEIQRLVAQGLEDLEAGRTAPHEEVMERLEAWAVELEKKRGARLEAPLVRAGAQPPCRDPRPCGRDTPPDRL